MNLSQLIVVAIQIGFIPFSHLLVICFSSVERKERKKEKEKKKFLTTRVL
jgi:hypothetical protein